MTGKTVAIIQTRMGSTRFPGKALQELRNRPVLRWVVDRANAAKRVDLVVVATTIHPGDDAIAAFCEREAIPCFRGSEQDVLGRFVAAADTFEAATVIRLTGDCPLLDPAVLDRLVSEFEAGDFDYASNTLRYTYPDGMDCEVMTADALKRADREATLPSDREHVTPYLKNEASFRRRGIESGVEGEPLYRVTVDHPADLPFIESILSHLTTDSFGWEDVVAVLKQHPEIATQGGDTMVNEGFYLSLGAEPVAPLGYRYGESVKRFAPTRDLIPDASQTFSKGPSQVSVGASPYFVERGEGPYLWDVDGNRFIDYTMGLGPCILGYSDPDVNAAVHTQIDKLTIASLCSPLEEEFARTLTRLIPCAEMVRYGKNGSDVTAASVRIARAHTGRDQILCAGYHGWQDWYIGTTTRRLGVPRDVQALTDTFTFNDINSLRTQLEKYPGKVAAVILEPVTAEAPKPGYLQEVVELAHAHGALAIFDEVITGFRFGLGGAQKLYGATPDLACFGKAMANGYPLAAVVGRRDVMSIVDKIFFSFTMGGELGALAAARATIEKMEREPVLSSVAEQGRRLMDGIRVLAKATQTDHFVSLAGTPPRSLFSFVGRDEHESLVMKTYFQQECAQRGLLFSGSHFISYAHTAAVVDHTLRIYATVLRLLKENEGKWEPLLLGPVLKPVFRRA